MRLNIDNPIIEVTRKCNMNCEHCLRGAAQRKVISHQHIHKFLGLIDFSSQMTITGGEPTLAMDSLHHIADCLTFGRCEVGNFYMVTNGKAINADKLARWINRMISVCTDNEISQVSFSLDTFHSYSLNNFQLDKRTRNFEKLKEILEEKYGYYFDIEENSYIGIHTEKGSLSYSNLIAEGKAKDFGTRIKEPVEFEILEDDDTVQINGAPVYLSANGWIVADCNWSYESIDKRKDIRIGHIDDMTCSEDLIEAIKIYNKQFENACVA